MRASSPPPVHHHAGLRKSERQKGSDGVKRYEPIRDAAKKKEQAAAKHRQDHDAIGINEATSAIAESVRKVIVLRDGAAKAREIRKGGVGGQRKNKENGGDSQIIEKALAEHGGNEHRENALVAGLARIRGHDAVSLHEIGDSRQQHPENENNHGEGALRVFHGRFAEGLHTVADRFDAG